MVKQTDRPPDSDDPEQRHNRTAFSRLPDWWSAKSSIPKLSSEGWRQVLLNIVDKLPAWGLAAIIWTAVVLLFILLIVREVEL